MYLCILLALSMLDAAACQIYTDLLYWPSCITPWQTPVSAKAEATTGWNSDTTSVI